MEEEEGGTPAFPVFRAALAAEPVGADRVMLVGETRQYFLAGKAYRAIAAHLDGILDAEQVLERASREAPLSHVLFAYRQLVRKGYVVEAPPPETPPGVAAWWDALGATPARAAARVAGTRVAVEAVVGGLEDPLCDALEAAGLRPTAATDGTEAPVRVVLTDDYLAPELAAVDERQRARGAPWLLAKPVGAVVWLGPLFVPGQTACWHCLADRVVGNRQAEAYVARRTGSERPIRTARARAHAPTRYALHLVAVAVERWVVTGAPPEDLRGRLATRDLLSWKGDAHQVVRRPQCPACGQAALRDPDRVPAPVALVPRLKTFTADGGHRTARPEETWERLKHHVSPLTGVVSTLERLSDDGAELAHSYNAGHNFAMVTDDLFFLRKNLRGQSGGKGMTEAQARISAVCEAVERWAGVWRGDEPRVRGSAREMGDSAVQPASLLGFSEAQTADRHRWNATQPESRQHLVPEPLPDDHRVDWTWATCLGDGTRRLVPAAYAFFGHPDLRRLFFCASDANGCAAGNTLEEAVLQGMLEVVERDAASVWWYNRLARPALDLASFGLGYVDRLRAYYRSLGREFWALDLTHDLGIPVVAAVSRRVGRTPEDVVIGLGAHLDPETALLRALTEMNQFLPAVAHTRPDGSTEYWFPGTDAHHWWRTARVGSEPWLLPDPRTEPRARSEIPSLATPDLAEDVRVGVALLARAGLETLVVDQTRPDVELHVAKVIVPGTRHFWRRLGPGRLYDAPVRMGWLDAPRREDEMNPWSVFF